MRPLRYSINVSLDGCVDHASTAFHVNGRTHDHAAEWLASNDLALFGRVTYQLMEAWRPREDGTFDDWVEPSLEPFARTIGDLPKLVVTSDQSLADPGWNVEVDDGKDLEATIRDLKAQPGKGIGLGGVKLAGEVARLGLIDEYELVTHPAVAGHGPYLFADVPEAIELREVERIDLGSGIVAVRYVPTER